MTAGFQGWARLPRLVRQAAGAALLATAALAGGGDGPEVPWIGSEPVVDLGGYLGKYDPSALAAAVTRPFRAMGRRVQVVVIRDSLRPDQVPGAAAYWGSQYKDSTSQVVFAFFPGLQTVRVHGAGFGSTIGEQVYRAAHFQTGSVATGVELASCAMADQLWVEVDPDSPLPTELLRWENPYFDRAGYRAQRGLASSSKGGDPRPRLVNLAAAMASAKGGQPPSQTALGPGYGGKGGPAPPLRPPGRPVSPPTAPPGRRATHPAAAPMTRDAFRFSWIGPQLPVRGLEDAVAVAPLWGPGLTCLLLGLLGFSARRRRATLGPEHLEGPAPPDLDLQGASLDLPARWPGALGPAPLLLMAGALALGSQPLGVAAMIPATAIGCAGFALARVLAGGGPGLGPHAVEVLRAEEAGGHLRVELRLLASGEVLRLGIPQAEVVDAGWGLAGAALALAAALGVAALVALACASLEPHVGAGLLAVAGVALVPVGLAWMLDTGPALR